MNIISHQYNGMVCYQPVWCGINQYMVYYDINLYMVWYGHPIENQEVGNAVDQEQSTHCDVLT